MASRNSFTEITSQSWGSRIRGSIKSVFLGFILFLAAFVVLWWNEGRAVKTAKGLKEGSGAVISISADRADEANANKLVHLYGMITAGDSLRDDEFNIMVNSLKLRRKVEMFQWKEERKSEKKKKVGGSEETITTYTYVKAWSSRQINSDAFNDTEGHTNPAVFPYTGYTKQVQDAKIGGFNVSQSLLNKINNFESYPVTDNNAAQIEDALVFNDGAVSKIYISQNSGTPAYPEIGDIKLHFEIVKPATYSIIAKQIGSTFDKYSTAAGTSIEMIKAGTVSAESMFTAAKKDNNIMTWVLRVVGFFVMLFGLNLIFKPLVVLADVLPFLGKLLSMGLSLFSGIVAFALSCTTIAIAWLFYRPVTGISILGAGVLIFVFFYRRAVKKKGCLQHNINK